MKVNFTQVGLFLTAVSLFSFQQRSSGSDSTSPPAASAIPLQSPEGAQGRSTPNPGYGPPDSVLLSIVNELSRTIGTNLGNLDEAQWEEARKKYWIKEFDEPLANASAPPENLLGYVLDSNRKSTLSEIMPELKNTGKKSPREHTLEALWFLATSCGYSESKSLPFAFPDRKTSSSPSKGDLILYDLFTDAFTNAVPKDSMSAAEFETWSEMATSPNPIYRLLAIRTFNKTITDKGQVDSFLRLYLDESNPYILGALIGEILPWDGINRLPLMEALKNNGNLSKYPELKSRIDADIEYMKKRYDQR